jgi:beta-glucosidase/6-phospho-beta-glucosidase/beta-galactosidase
MDLKDMKLSQEQQDQLLFMMLVQQHEQIGMMGLGKIKNPVTDKLEPDINSAKYAIDTLNMIERYTSGNLNSEMKSYLQHILSTLRLNFVDAKKATTSESPESTDIDSDSPESDSSDTPR